MFGFSASAAATPAAAPANSAAPAPAPTGFSLSSSAAEAPAAAAKLPVATADAPPQPPNYSKLFDRACRDGTVSDAFVQEIKKLFAFPMEVKTSTTTTATPATGAAAAPTLAPATAPGTSTLARNTEAQQQQQQRQIQVENAQNLLQLLLMCNSGYNNSEAPPQWAETSKESVKGLHAAVGAIAASAASNLIAFVKASVVKHTQALDGESTSNVSLFADSRRKRANDDPTLLAAQCLYILSRHFQLTANVVKEALDLVDSFYFLLKNSLRSRLVPLSTFSDSSDTSVLNTLMWLCTFSVVNMVAVWKKLRSANGELRPNDLVQSNVAASIEDTVSNLRKRLRESVQTSASHNSLYSGGAAAGARASPAFPMPPTVYTWQVILDSYLSILTLAEGCLLRTKGSDQGFDKALDAFLGERVTAVVSMAAPASSLSPSLSPSAPPAVNASIHCGKVTKRMVELAPVPRTLSIPVGLLYIAPYEMMSYLFDEMLPLLRHLSELEVASHRRYIEQLEDLPRISSTVREGQNGFQQRMSPGLQSSAEGEDGWPHRITHVGRRGEVVGDPFTSEMAHLLEALAICLQHLQPEVLNPDLDADCAATFFIFKNFIKHMRQVFTTQRSGDGGSDTVIASAASAVWENYTLKLMTKFLEVLAMIGRNPQYTQRVVVLLTDAQTECSELQWHSLVNQALECAGFNSGVLSVPGTSDNGSGMSLSAMAASQTSASSRPAREGGANGGAESSDVYAATSAVVMRNGVPCSLHHQFTHHYARKCQRQFISSFFLLLRQLFAHSTLRPIVSAYINLELALTFLLAPQQNQVMLGSTLSLISALVTSASDAQLVWSFLEQHHLLQQSSTRSQRGSRSTADGTAASYDRHTITAAASTNGASGNAAGLHEPITHEETLSLIGHCQYETTQGTYDITIGFLHLITALLQKGQPSMAALSVYTTVTSFISQEILRGVLKRVFIYPHERYTVFALAAAALRQALLVRFHGENGRTTVLQFANVMAINKAPADVVGEVVRLVFEASDAPYELLSHHRAAVRQALKLLITAVQTVQEQKIELLLFDTRTTLNTDLAVRVLGLCSLQDTLLTKTTLQLLLLFPLETANQAAHYWSASTAKYAPVLDTFAHLLHPLNTVPVVVQAPPELAQLDFDTVELVPGWPSALLISTKSLLLDLLMRHADVTQPSLTAWMCGFYHEEFSTHDRRAHANAAAGNGDFSSRDTASTREDSSWWRSTLLTSVVEGACSNAVERAHPALAVKFVKLLYLLRANSLYGSLVVRPFLERVCQTLFLRLQHFHASQCTPVGLSKYAYVMKLLALEACYTYRTSPEDLRLTQSTSISSISVEVLLSLLYPFGNGAASPAAGTAALESSRFPAGSFVEGGESSRQRHDDDDNSNKNNIDRGGIDGSQANATTIVSRDAVVDITTWLPQALQLLPTFPEKLPPITGGCSHLIPCAADGVVQYNMASLYEAFQLEQVRANKPPLTMAELREKLRPFIAANDCFFAYAAGVSFVEGWCQLVSVVFSVVQGLSVLHLRTFALCILRGLDETTSMTAAAQEQVCTRLCHCLSTVLAHLRKSTLASAYGLPLEAAHAAEAQWSKMPNYDGSNAGAPAVLANGKLVNGSAGALGSYRTGQNAMLYHYDGERETAQPMADTHANGVGKRRFREGNDAAARASHGVRQSSNLFSTQAGEVSNLDSTGRRSQLAQALLQRRQADRAAAANAFSANAVVLQPLVHALVHWGTRIASIRASLYMSLLCLAETPGINLDDVVLWRSQKALLSLICADICSACAVNPPASTSASGAAATTALNGVVSNGVSNGNTAGATGATAAAAVDALSPQVQHAVALLVALLQASAPIRDDFCNPTLGSKDGMGTWALRCTTALLQSVDNAVCRFFANTGASLGSLLWHIRSTFDLLSVVSLGHAPQVLHSNLLEVCFAMQAWKYSTQVVLGYSQAPIAPGQMLSKPLVEQNKEVLRRLLLGVVRWVNLLLSTLGDATPLLYEVQKFIRNNRSLIDYVFISPAALSSTLPGSSQLSGSHLTLCAELSECLRALSSSVLAVDCRTLVDSMALPDLLSMLSSEEVWRRGPTDFRNFTDVDGVSDGITGSISSYSGEPAAAAAAARYTAAVSGSTATAVLKRISTSATAVSIAERGRDVVALTVRNLSHLLLNAEYGLRGMEIDFPNHNSSSTPMLRFSASKRNLCIRIVRQVAHSLDEISGAGAHPFRLECYLYALHALVCLLHSFVLPLDQVAPQLLTPDDFMRYLKSLPLHELAEVLMQSRDAVYQLKRFNTDYRGGMRAQRLNTRHPWAAAVDAGGDEPAMGDDAAATQSLSNEMRSAGGDRGDGAHATPKSTPVPHSAEAFSVPSTPGMLPSPEAQRGGRDVAVSNSGGGSAGRALPATVANGAAGGPIRDLNATVVQNLAGTEGPFHAVRKATSLLPATDNGEKLHPDSTLWNLLQSHNTNTGELTRVYDSFQNNDARECDLDYTGSRDASQQWANVLNVESEVRQIKVAIANALRATKGAMKVLGQMQ